MKWLKKIKTKNKILIIILSSLLIALFNFIFYNFQIIKSGAKEQYFDFYNIEYENFELKDGKLISNSDSAKVIFNFDNSYVDELMFNYESDYDYQVSYNGETANYYGILKPFTKSETCYSIMDVCGININNKVGTLTLEFKGNVVLNSLYIDNTVKFNFVTFIFWLVTVDLILTVILFSDFFTKKKHYLAFMLSMGFGIVLLLSGHNMTTTTLDDDTHYINSNVLTNPTNSLADSYLKSYSVSFKNLDTIKEKKSYQKFLNSNDEIKKYHYTNHSLFSTSRIVYLPVNLVLKVLSLFGINKMTSFFIGRLTSLIIYSLCVFFAVKIIPVKKLLLMFIMLLPQCVFLATNYNYDPFVIGSMMLSFALFMREYYNKEEKLNIKNILLCIITGLYAIFPKAIYAPFLLVLLLLPSEKFKNKKQLYLFRLIVIAITVVAFSTFIINSLFTSGSLSDSRGGAVSVSGQLRLIINAPLSFIKVFYKSAFLETLNRLFSPITFGQLSYYGSMGIDSSYYLIIFVFFLCLFEKSDKKSFSIKSSHKLFMLLLYAIIICLIWGSMYLGFTPIGETVINGVQPRYFIPLLFPLLLLLSTPKMKIEYEDNHLISMSTIVFTISFMLLIYNVIIVNYCL